MRRGYTLTELVAATGVVFLLTVVLVPVGERMAGHHRELTAYADDLASGVRVADRLAAEVRSSAAVFPAAPSGVRTGARGLVLERPTGEVLALSLEAGAGAAQRVVLTRFDATGRPRGREVLGVVGGLDLGYDARRPAEVRLVRFDVRLPRRDPRARPAVLSSAALVAAGEAP